MKPCRGKDLRFVAKGKTLATSSSTTGSVLAGLVNAWVRLSPHGVATLLVRASQIGGDRDRLALANDGCSVFEAVVRTLIYLKPSSDEGPKSIRGLNMRAVPSSFGDRSE